MKPACIKNTIFCYDVAEKSYQYSQSHWGASEEIL